MANQDTQQCVFAASQAYLGAITSQGPVRQIEFKGAELHQGLPSVQGTRSARERRYGLSFQDGAYAGEQLARTERLGKIVVGAHFEPYDPIHFISLCGKYDDRDIV
jgi:hypothetical protein